MKFKERLTAYSNEGYALIDKFSLILFAMLRNHPLRSDGWIHKVKPFISLRTKSFNGYKVLLNTSNFSHFVIADEFIQKPIYNLAKVKFRPEVIIDCGAHIGLFTVLAASNFPNIPIICFEPLPENIQMIKKHIKINNLKNVNLEEAAVSTKNGHTTFYIANASFGGSLQASSVDAQQSKPLVVKIRDLKEYLKNYSGKKLLLKMDIEGEEENIFPEILPLLPSVCAIFFETHSERGQKNIYSLLDGYGFNTSVIRTVDQYGDHFSFRT